MSKLAGVKTEELKRTLTELGFIAKDSSGAHVLFSHAQTGAVISVPTQQEDVPTIYVNTAARQVANSGIATVDRFKHVLKNGNKIK